MKKETNLFDQDIVEASKRYMDKLDKSGKRANSEIFIKNFKKLISGEKLEDGHMKILLDVLDDLILGKYRSDFVKTIKAGTCLYRARIVSVKDYNKQEKGIGYTQDGIFSGYSWEESKEPPYDKIKEGRNNAKGEVVLYLASDKMTACFEVRPGIMQVVSVGELFLDEDVEILDFSPQNGFKTLLNVYDDKYRMDIRHLISQFLFFFSQPVYDDKSIYKITQFICKHYREKHGFKGIAYRSFYSDGINYTFFDEYMRKFIMPGKSELLLNYAVANLFVSLDADGSNKDIDNFNEKISKKPTDEVRSRMRGDLKYLIDRRIN